MTRLFCSFTFIEDLDDTIILIKNTYSILYDKIFVLLSDDMDELMCTYNVDKSNINPNIMISNTILANRNKEYNVIYTVNALNHVIKTQDIQDSYRINWKEYEKCLLLTRKNVFTVIPTKIHSIIFI